MPADRPPRRPRAFRPSTKPQPVAALVDGTFRWLKLDEVARSFRAARAFAVAAGPRIGAHARAERLRGALLYVRCESSAWSQHLHAMKAQLLVKLARTPGGEVVRDLRATVGPLNEVPDWEIGPAAADEGAEAAHAVPAELERAFARLDPALRERFEELYRRFGSRGR